MPPFRVILIELDRSATSVVMASFDRAPDIGSTIELPNGDHATVRHVVSDPSDKLGVVIAVPL